MFCPCFCLFVVYVVCVVDEVLLKHCMKVNQYIKFPYSAVCSCFITRQFLSKNFTDNLRNFLETFVHNPQFFVTLSVPDDDDEDGLCTLIVSLMQKGRRQLKHEGVGMLSIGNN